MCRGAVWKKVDWAVELPWLMLGFKLTQSGDSTDWQRLADPVLEDVLSPLLSWMALLLLLHHWLVEKKQQEYMFLFYSWVLILDVEAPWDIKPIRDFKMLNTDKNIEEKKDSNHFTSYLFSCVCQINVCVSSNDKNVCILLECKKVFICECVDVYACVRSPIYRVLHTSKSVAV